MPTPKQIAAVRAAIHRHGLLSQKETIVLSYTNNRTEHISEMTTEEVSDLLSHFNDQSRQANPNSKLMGKLFAMCHEMGWIAVNKVVQGNQVKERKDYSRVHGWVKKYGYLKKELREYTYEELPRLVTQLELHVYNPYIEALAGAKKAATEGQQSAGNKIDSPFL